MTSMIVARLKQKQIAKAALSFLKEKILGNYLIISDDLDQYSLLNNFSLTDIVSLPIKAGVDIIIFGSKTYSV